MQSLHGQDSIGAQEVWHPVQDDFESCCTKQGSRTPCAVYIMPTFVDLEDVIVEALRTHLHFGHAEGTQPTQFFRIDFVWACFDNKSYITVMGGFVDGVSDRSSPSPVQASPFGRLCPKDR